MKIEQLIKMANQIGQFFESEPDQQQAVQDVAAHIKRFWDPRMRKVILAHASDGGEGLLPIVVTAIQKNRQMLS